MQNFIEIERLKEKAAALGVSLDETALERFDIYAKALVEWNEKINLTAITQPQDIVTKHFADSLTLLRHLRAKHAGTLLDVGTGAGFPGLALLIADPALQVTLLDSIKKKLTVLQDILGRLSLSAALLHGRAEDLAHDARYREQFDAVMARAVAALPVLAEYCLPFVRVGGTFYAMKSVTAAEEVKDAQPAIRLLGGDRPQCKTMTLEDVGERCLILVGKRSATSQKYPRPSAKIAKEPLGQGKNLPKTK